MNYSDKEKDRASPPICSCVYLDFLIVVHGCLAKAPFELALYIFEVHSQSRNAKTAKRA